MKTLTKDDSLLALAAPEDESLNLLQLIHDDNSYAAELFFQFSQAEGDDDKQELFEVISAALTVHSQLVEEVLFPTVIDTAEEEEEEEAEKLVAVAEAGNYVAALLLDELGDMEPNDEFFEAKMTILCELSKLQVKREEKEMFEKLRAADIDMEELGEKAAGLKADLEENALSKQTKSKSSYRKPARGAAGGRQNSRNSPGSKVKTSSSKGPTKSKPSTRGTKSTKKATPSNSRSKTTSRKRSK